MTAPNRANAAENLVEFVDPDAEAICREIRRRRRFLITSHARPDGDSIGSQLAMAYALEALGKEVRIVNADPAPDHYMEFPGLAHIEIARSIVERDAEALIVMESGDLKRTGVSGLESDGANLFYCGGGASGKVRAVRRPQAGA